MNVKFYGKQESLLDIHQDALPDYYLVLSGPRSQGGTSRGATRPVLIEYVHLFHSPPLWANYASGECAWGWPRV